MNNLLALCYSRTQEIKSNRVTVHDDHPMKTQGVSPQEIRGCHKVYTVIGTKPFHFINFVVSLEPNNRPIQLKNTYHDKHVIIGNLLKSR